MEIMTKEEYLKDRLGKLLQKMEEIENVLNEVRYGSHEVAVGQTNAEIERWLELEGDEEAPHFVNSEFDDAYDAYVEANEEEPDHVYEVDFEIRRSGSVVIRANNYDEASEYANNEIYIDSDGGPYFSDDEKQVDDFDFDSDDIEITGIYDNGEYEE